MKRFISNIILILSYVIYRLSGRRLLTKAARRCRQQYLEKNARRIEEIQRQLDEEHLRTHGWTAADDRLAPSEDVNIETVTTAAK